MKEQIVQMIRHNHSSADSIKTHLLYSYYAFKHRKILHFRAQAILASLEQIRYCSILIEAYLM